MRPRVWLSRTRDVALNLALEDVLLKTAEAPQCVLYVNSPCVVVGRNQNAWGELDSRAMQSEGVELVRRQSGGGTVYHDEGNLNFSFHVQKDGFVRRTHTDLVSRALASDPVRLPWRFGRPPVFANERNDLCVYARDMSPTKEAERKVSGSAYRMAMRRVYHHGTLLLDAQIDRMRFLKRESASLMESRAVESVRSPVANLTEIFPRLASRLSPENVATAIKLEFERVYGASDIVEYDERALYDAAIEERYNTLKSWDWIFGGAPEFSVHAKGDSPLGYLDIRISCQHGIITQVSANSHDTVAQELVGLPYDAIAPAPPSAAPVPQIKPPASHAEQTIRAWLYEHL
ncbi:lipoate--protein ligase [Malassezia cuniculi]|uniref:Putative lipoate-protein ligase A n=1 Tax=Malassezia cuniculi TaxID=948313 RepID=A0AAF0EYL3_9BASI|nr:lipoate--protein ligase [Malassezia cuniculi]